MNIAIILTCHNRKEKTVNCLKSLSEALQIYNGGCKKGQEISFKLFLTDDGCTDGTAESVKPLFNKKNLHIVVGDGNLYWAGGMRKAWKVAMQDSTFWDFYLLLNDDTILLPNTFKQLMEAHEYATKIYGKAGIYSGICADIHERTKTTYGGNVWVNKLTAASRRLSPTGTPQPCDMTNANILLICKAVVDKIGVFYEGFQHGIADFDYSIQAKYLGFPLLLTSDYCGICENDHGTLKEKADRIVGMSLHERKAFYKHPLHSNRDYLTFIRRNAPLRYPMVLIGRFVNVYFPQLYYKYRRKE